MVNDNWITVYKTIGKGERDKARCMRKKEGKNCKIVRKEEREIENDFKNEKVKVKMRNVEKGKWDCRDMKLRK